MNRGQWTKAHALELRRLRLGWPEKLERFSVSSVITTATILPTEAWRSRYFACMVYPTDEPGVLRVSVNRCEIDMGKRDWTGGITWDELMRVKREIGRGNCHAVEVLPRDSDVVDVANMRHFWVFVDDDKAPSFIWRGSGLAG